MVMKGRETELKASELMIEGLISEGEDAYRNGDYEKSVEMLSQAASLTAKQFGESSQENALPLFLYGRSLFNVGQLKSDILVGSSLFSDSIGENSLDVNEDFEAIKQAVISFGDDFSSKNSEHYQKSDSNKKSTEYGEENRLISTEKLENIERGKVEDSKEERCRNDMNDDGDDGDDFALAWEVLEYSRVLYENLLNSNTHNVEETKKLEIRIAEIHDILGEISLENGSFDIACRDLKKALEIKQRAYEDSDPIVSEAHYKLALALEFSESCKEDAIKHVKLAIDSVRKRVEIEKKMANAENLNIKEALEMLNDLNQKVVELESSDRNEDAPIVLDSKPIVENVKDLSHLIKRKRI